MLRSARKTEVEELVAMGESTGIFGPGEADELLRTTCVDYFNGKLPKGHEIVVYEEDGLKRGWCYYAPSSEEEAKWDVWWIGTDPLYHGKGYGRKLLAGVENHIKEHKGAIVVIETSSAPALEKARAFYPKMGYKVVRIGENFYGPKLDKIIYTKTL